MGVTLRAGTAVLFVLLAACHAAGGERDYSNEVQAEFTRAFSCPAASVTVTPRTDLNAYDLQVGPIKPPAEVAADPARLAEWKRQQDKVKDGYTSERVFKASGCAHSAYYICSPATGTNEQQVVACSTPIRPPPN
jgi:hypothetical protein